MANLRSTWATLWASDSSRCWSCDTWSPDCLAVRPSDVRLGTLAKLACLWWIWRLMRSRACPRSLSRPLSIHWRRIVGSIPHTHRELLPDSHSLASWCTRYAFSLAMVGNNFIVSVERYIKRTKKMIKRVFLIWPRILTCMSSMNGMIVTSKCCTISFSTSTSHCNKRGKR